MSQVDKLLDSLTDEELAAYGTTSESEPHIVIGNNRRIIIPEQLKRIAVQYDHNVETVIFDCPRYWDNHDMSTMAIYINYMRSDGYADSYPADNVTVDGDIMHFSWTISRNVTEVQGNISFLVCVKNTDAEGNEINHWNSELSTGMYVSEGMETEEQVLEFYPDLVTQLLLRMDSVEKINIQASEMNSLLASTEEAKDAAENARDIALDESDYIKNSYANAIKGTAKGEIVRVDDVSPIEHSVKCIARGKNLIPYPYADTTKTIGGITFTDNGDGSITANGTATSNAVFYFTNVGTNQYINGTVCLSGCPEGGSVSGSGYSVRLNQYINGVETSGLVDTGAGKSGDFDNKLVRVYFVILTGTTVENLTVAPMLEYGVVPSVYEPWIDPSTIAVTGCGKNLFDSNVFNSVTGWKYENGMYSGLPAYLHAAFGPNGGTPIITCFKPKTQYIVSFMAYADVTEERSVGGTVRFEYTDGSHDSININTATKAKYEFISRADKSVAALRMSYGHNITTYLGNVQLEEGNVATAYESYSGETVQATDGSVDISSVSPTMTIFTDTPGVIVEAEYNRDTTKAMASYIFTEEIKQDIADIVEEDLSVRHVKITNGSTITLQDNCDYYSDTPITSLTIKYPSGDFISSVSFTLADAGSINISLPESKCIGTAPAFANGETWELSIKNGVVVGGLVE